jgi:hypothetical protein
VWTLRGYIPLCRGEVLNCLHLLAPLLRLRRQRIPTCRAALTAGVASSVSLQALLRIVWAAGSLAPQQRRVLCLSRSTHCPQASLPPPPTPVSLPARRLLFPATLARADVMRREAWEASRVESVLLDYGETKTVLSTVATSALFSQRSFWEYVARKEAANKMYLISIPQVWRGGSRCACAHLSTTVRRTRPGRWRCVRMYLVRTEGRFARVGKRMPPPASLWGTQAVSWTAAVCLEYVSHAFPPMELELQRAREEVQRMKAQVCHRQCSQSSKFSQAPRAVR